MWAKYFVVMLAAPLALFVLLDPQARRHFATPGPYVAIAVALVVAAPHLVWLVQNDFLPFPYAEARAAPSRGLLDHAWHPLQFVIGQLAFLLPGARHRAPLFLPRADRKRSPAPMPSTAASSRCWRSGRRRPSLRSRSSPAAAPSPCGAIRSGCSWAMDRADGARARSRDALQRACSRSGPIVFFGFAAAFFANYARAAALSTSRYRAVFFPGDRLGAELSAAFAP